MTHACPAAHLGSEMWENEGNAYHVYMQLSFGRQFLFFIVFFFFLPIKHTNNNTSRLCFLLDHLFLSQTHTYTYIWKPELTLVRRLLVLGFVYKEYGSFVEKILGGVV